MTKLSYSYSVHPSIAHMEAMLSNLKKNTGRTIDEWLKLLKASGIQTPKAQKEWLKKEFELGGATTMLIVNAASDENESDAKAYLTSAATWVDNLYAKDKSALRPIHEAIIGAALALDKNIKICPCKTMVPLYRKNVFAQIKPATRTRIDLGLCLRDIKTPKRLLPTGGLEKGDRITHKIELTTLADFDEEAKKWLSKAYELG